jgi:SAM-dependent methyltransferase
VTEALRSKGLVRPCPVCGHGAGEVLATRAFALPEGSRLPESYDVVACERCGCCFADTAAPQDAYDHYYTECSRYEDPNTSSSGGDRSDDRSRLDSTAAYIASHLAAPDAGVLDIGCGGGGLLRALAGIGCGNLAGIDPSAVCVERVAASGAGGTQGTVFSRAPEGAGAQRYGCVALTHVLEHVRDVGRAVESVSTWLAPDGLLYIEVPDAGRYAQRFVVADYYFDIEHINHFDEGALRNLAAAHGFDVVDITVKDLTLADGVLYPCVAMLCRLPALGRESRDSVRSDAARDSILEYVRLSACADPAAGLSSLGDPAAAVAVWGAGSYAQRLFAGGLLAGLNVAVLVDGDGKKQGSTLAGLPVQAPEALRSFDGPVLVAAALYGADIEREIRAMGLPNQVVVLR